VRSLASAEADPAPTTGNERANEEDIENGAQCTTRARLERRVLMLSARLTMALPHYLRFARAAALLGGLAATPGCYASHLRAGDVPDAATPDAPAPDAFVNVCETCRCSFGRMDPGSCEATGHFLCCPVTGPLSPPEL
jgi:hypothetical protein